MPLFKRESLADLFLLAVSLIWVVWIVSDYYSKFILYGIAFEKFHFYGLLFRLVILAGATVFLLRLVRRSGKVWLFRGIWVVVYGLLIVLLASHATFSELLEPSGRFAFRLGNIFGTLFSGIGGPLLFLISAYALGTLLLDQLPLRFRKSDLTVLRLLVGFGLWMTVLFVLGALHILIQPVAIILTLLPIAFRYKAVIQWLRKILWEPDIDFGSKLSIAGILSLNGLILLISINLIRVQTPLPTGSDAQNYYINLAKLIDSYDGLVAGFQPYNWSLITAMGYHTGNGTPSALVLAMLGGILSLVALYRIGRTMLDANPNILLFALFLFYLTPTVTIQSVAELKIDLGLLFMSLGLLLLFWYVIRAKEWKYQNHLTIYMLIGCCAGWLMGTKLTALFLVMGLVAVLWYRRAGPRAHFAAVLLVLGLSLLVGLDQIIRIDQEHLGRVPVMLACLIFGIILVVLEFRTNKVAISQALRQSLIIGLCSGLTFFPWIVKNAIETGSSQPRKLLMGAEPGVPLDIGIIKELMEQ